MIKIFERPTAFILRSSWSQISQFCVFLRNYLHLRYNVLTALEEFIRSSLPYVPCYYDNCDVTKSSCDAPLRKP